MKRPKPIHKVHSLSRSRYELKHKLKYKDWRARRNANSALLLYRYSINKEYKPITYVMPAIFVIRENTNEVVKFIKDLKKHKYSKKPAFINMRDVDKMTNGAIALLLSAVLELNAKGIRVVGNLPNDKNCETLLVNSGFFKHVTANFAYEDSAFDTMITKGNQSVESPVTAPIVRNAMKTVTGDRVKNTAVQGMLIELMANTVNHAYPRKKSKKWVLSVSHDFDNKKVSFSFVDNGVGIIETLNLSLGKKLNSYFSGNAELLQSAFEGTIGSRTGLNYRGRGLPAIFKKFNSNKLKEFVVITNRVFIDFTNNRRVDLDTEFTGTYYYWELKN